MVTDLRRLKRTTDSGVQAVRSPTAAVVAVRQHPLARLGRWSWPLAGALVLAIAAGGFGAWRVRHRQTGFKPGDRILVADVENATSRLELGALRGVLLDMLEANGVERFIGPDDVQEFEKSRATGAVPFIDAPLAERICRAGECAGYLTGRIEVQDGGYRLEVRVQRIGETRPTVSRSAVAQSEPDLLMTIYRLCRDLRQALGEGPERLDLPPPPGTASLAAYQTMVAVGYAEDNFAQIAIMKKAIERDPKWALPYWNIGIGYSNLGDWREFRKWTAEARKRSAGLSELERLTIESAFLESYYRFDEDVENLRSLQHLYPFVGAVYDWLAWDYNNIFEDPVSAEPAYRKSYELTPFRLPLGNLAQTLQLLGRADAIDALIAEHLAKGGKERDTETVRFRSAALRGDLKAARDLLDRMTGAPGDQRADAHSLWLDLLLSTGRLREAEAAVAETVRSATEARNIESRLRGELIRSWLEGRSRGGRARLSRDEIVPADKTFYHIPGLATVAVSLRLSEPLATLLREHEADLAGSTSGYVKEEMQFAHACLRLIGGQAGGAVELLEPLARNSILLRRHHVLGYAYESLGRWQEAATQYEEVLKYPYRKGYLVIPALWVLDEFRLAGAYDHLGDAARARQRYEMFLADWKDADPDIPEVVQAKERLAALGGPRGHGE